MSERVKFFNLLAERPEMLKRVIEDCPDALVKMLRAELVKIQEELENFKTRGDRDQLSYRNSPVR